MLVATIREEVVSTANPMTTRPPLLLSEIESNTTNGDHKRKPRVKHVPSRYLLPSPSTTTTTTSVHPWSSSRPKTAVPNSKPSNVSSAASKLLFTSSRSVSVSFQGDTFSLPVIQARKLNSSSLRNGMLDQRRRPGKGMQDNLHLGDVEPSDTASVSSRRAVRGPLTAPRGLVVSRVFWQETNSRLRHLQDPCIKPASLNKLLVPNGICTNRICSTFSDVPSIISFSVDLPQMKRGKNCIADAHTLRLLYNRYLQWRFINARTDASLLAQKLSAEKHIWNAFITITEGRRSVTVKRTKLLLLRQKLKLVSVLKEQMPYLEQWGFLENEYSSSLLAASDALKAATVRLPVHGITVDIHCLKDTISSALSVMHAISSTICSLLSKVEEVNSLLAELVNVASEEQFSLHQCAYLLRIVAYMQVHDCSLRTYILQLSQTFFCETRSLTTLESKKLLSSRVL